ncbi:cell wall hydrolase/autolysin [Streptococcus suis]|nr:cell wall hydrolase/autolysin [Streptococcus suis]
MKKKSLLFLSLCAWTLQSHLVQADTIVDAASQASQETEMSGLSNSNISASQRTPLTVANEGTKQSKTLVAENTTVSSLQMPSSEIVGSANSMSELTNQGEFISDSTTISNEVKPDQETTSSNAISVTSGGSLTKENASVASSTSSTSAGTGNAVTTPSTNIAARSMVSSSSQSTTSTQPSNVVAIENVNAVNGSFDVRVSKVSSPKEIKEVYIPTWSEVNGQDDIIWYAAKRQLDGSYLINVDNAQHKKSVGKYHSHVYYLATDGSLSGIGATSAVLPELKASGKVSAVNVNQGAGSFEVKISDIVAPKGIAKVLVPTWTESGGQDDIVWHEASRQSDGSYLARINKNQHKYSSGKYISHVYYRGTDGSMTAVGGTSVELPSTRSYTVYIDPGHGGRDSGASYGGVHEKNLALSVSNKLRENLLKYGINVLMTRTGDYDVDFKTERSRMTNASNADLFISIHFNATGAGVSNSSGIETYWYQYDPEYQPKINKEMHNNPTRLAESEILANKVQESLIKETGAVNRGVRRETFAVLRETAIPAILVELGFMNNPSELQVIKQDSYHTRLAKALAQGVMNWYGAVEGK